MTKALNKFNGTCPKTEEDINYLKCYKCDYYEGYYLPDEILCGWDSK